MSAGEIQHAYLGQLGCKRRDCLAMLYYARNDKLIEKDPLSRVLGFLLGQAGDALGFLLGQAGDALVFLHGRRKNAFKIFT